MRNKAILREWIESEVNAGGDGERRKNGGKEGKGEAEGDEGENAEKFRTLVQGLGYAVQVGPLEIFSFGDETSGLWLIWFG